MKLYESNQPTQGSEVASLAEAKRLLKGVAAFGNNALYVVEDGTTYHLFVVKHTRVMPFKLYERLAHVRGMLLQTKVLIPFILHFLVVHYFGPLPEPSGFVLATLTTLVTVYLIFLVVSGRNGSSHALDFWLNVWETRKRLEAKGLTAVH